MQNSVPLSEALPNLNIMSSNSSGLVGNKFWRFGLLLTIAYVVSGKLGLMLALPPGYASPIFPPAGIAVAAALFGGRKTLLWIFLGSLLLNLWAGYTADHQMTGIEFIAASIIATASVIQAAIGAWLLRRILGYPAPLDHGSDLLRFLLLAPVICLASASLSVSGLAALGIVNADSFAATWAAWWVGDTLGVVVMFPLAMIVAGEPRALWQSRVRTVAAPMLLTLAFLVVVFLNVNQWERDNSLLEFRQISQQVANQIQTKLEEQEFLLEQTTGLFIHDESDHITRKEFHRFIEKSLARFPMLKAVEWAPSVDSARRSSFEAEQHKESPGFEIRERNTAGQLQRADKRGQFYPVTYVEPLSGNEAAVGFDLASSPDRLAALTKAVANGGAVTTAPLHLVQEQQEQAGMLLLTWVQVGSKESGVALTVLRIGDFMDKLLSDSRSMLYVRLIDIDAQKTMYDSFVAAAEEPMLAQSFIFGTRHYELQTTPTPAYLMQHRGWQSWGVLAAGILGSGLLGALLLLGSGYTARVNAQVQKRTRDLKLSESRLQDAQRIGHIGSWELDILSGVLIWSKEIYRIFEIDSASFGASYEAFLNAIHPDDRALVDSAYNESLKKKMPYQIEHRLLFPDGRIKFVHEQCETFYDAEGRPLRSIGTVQDISERKKLELELSNTNAQQELILKSVGEGIYGVDLNGHTTFVNSAATKMLGWSADELIGRTMHAITHHTKPNGTPYPAEQCHVYAAFKDGQAHHVVDEVFWRKDGSSFPVDYISTPMRASGNIVGAVAIFRDITERREREEMMRLATTVFNSVDEAVMVTDPDRRIITVNPAFISITGYSAEEIMGKNPSLLSSGRHPPEFYQEMWITLNATGRWSGEIWNRRKSGQIYVEWQSINLVRDENGNITHYVSVFSDISERKTAAERLEHLAHFDMLTDLPNRRLFTDRLQQALATAKRDKGQLALMFLDLDRFKPINDTLGHDIGDLLLKEAAQRMQNCVRESDTVARIGGDKFVVLLPNIVAAQDALLVAEKIRCALNQPFELAGHSLGISSSIGIAIYPEHGKEAMLLTKNADIAMYHAKKSGRNSVKLYQSDMHEISL